MYMDPHTGGVLFQALAGMLAVFSGVMLAFLRNIRQWISRVRRQARKDKEVMNVPPSYENTYSRVRLV